MSVESSIELDHCRELAVLPGSLFEFTSNFIKTEQLPSLLALYALHQTISTIPDSPSDDSIKWAKLKWWSEEINEDPASPSRHPVLRALWQSGARELLDNVLLQQLVRDAFLQIDAVPDSDEKAMFERLSVLGATPVQLEFALGKVEIDPNCLGFLAAATGTYCVISSFAPGQRRETEWLPLSVLAKHGLSAEQIQAEEKPSELSLIVAELAESSLDWFSKGISGMGATTGVTDGLGECAHLQLRLAIEKRRVQAIRKNVRNFVEKGRAFGPSDAWFAWRFLRQLND